MSLPRSARCCIIPARKFSVPLPPKKISLGYELSSGLSKTLWVLLVLVSSAAMLLILRWLHFYLHPERNSWSAFWGDWGAAIGVLYGVILTAIVATLPSRVEDFMTTLAERIQSPLTDFSQVIERASQLLDELGHRKGTVFKVISASPILGLELNDSSGNRWERLLVSRIQADRATDIICLDPGTQFSSTAPLTTFCRAMAEHYLRDPNCFAKLLSRGTKQIQKFQDDYREHKNLTMKFGEEPGYQIIIARDEKGISKAILFFSSSQTLIRGIKPVGFSTEDATMVKVLEMLFDQCSDAAKEAPDDPRTLRQRERDSQLQVLHEQEGAEAREIKVDVIAPGFTLIVRPEVFPPDFELAGEGFIHAIEKSAAIVWKDVPVENRLGIDVGTGTGILALVLAKYCSKVLATDNIDIAVKNAEENFKRYRTLKHPPVSLQAKYSDLLEQVDPLSAGQVPLIVFNHPYYPSPANLFNIGGDKAGLKLIRLFFQQAQSHLNHGGGIVMAYPEIAERHNPVMEAARFRYRSEELLKGGDEELGTKQTIFLFTK